MVLHYLVDKDTHKVVHAAMSYTKKGEYKGDFEMNYESDEKFFVDGDYTNVKKQWPKHSFIREDIQNCEPVYLDAEHLKIPEYHESDDHEDDHNGEHDDHDGHDEHDGHDD
jgi:hypothetical protein